MDAERGDPDDVGDVLKMGPAAVEVGDVADREAERHDRPDERHCAGSPRTRPETDARIAPSTPQSAGSQIRIERGA